MGEQLLRALAGLTLLASAAGAATPLPGGEQRTRAGVAAKPDGQTDLEAGSARSLDPYPYAWLSQGAGSWESSGWLRLSPTPKLVPERWRVEASGHAGYALVVRGEPGAPAVVLRAHLEGTARVAQYLARVAARSGYQVIAFVPPLASGASARSVETFAAALRERILTGRAAVRLARGELQASCVGLLGISLGALVAVPVAALEPDVEGVVAMLGGADLPRMFEESADLLFERFGMRRDGSYLADPRLSLVDPATWASRIDPARVLLIRARWDRIISRDAAQRLRSALGNPEQHVFPSGHSSFELFVPIAARSALAHVESRCAAVDEE